MCDGFENEKDFQFQVLVYPPPTVVEHHSNCDELRPSLLKELYVLRIGLQEDFHKRYEM